MVCIMNFKDSVADEAAYYWLQTVIEDRAESAPSSPAQAPDCTCHLRKKSIVIETGTER